MSLRLYLALPIGVAVVAAVYWILSYDSAGTVMLAGFAGALGILGLSLLPTLPNVGPTAPVEDEEPGGSGQDATGH